MLLPVIRWWGTSEGWGYAATVCVGVGVGFCVEELFEHGVGVWVAVCEIDVVLRGGVGVGEWKSVVVFLRVFISDGEISFTVFDILASSEPLVIVGFARIADFHTIFEDWVWFNKIEYMKGDFPWLRVDSFEEEPLCIFCRIDISWAE
jgi:hypothetical protein